MFALIDLLLLLALVVIVGWVILSYVVAYGRLPWGHPVRRIYDAIDNFLQPVLSPLRRVLPPVRIGARGLDLSPMVLMFGIAILRAILPG